MTKIAVIGTGYVGLVTGTGFAELGNEVTCVDIDKKKIDNLNNGIIPIYEPGLEEMIERNQTEKRLFFTTNIQETIKNCQLFFIAVGTPPGEDGSADLQHVLAVAKNIATNMDNYKLIITKSTVPVGTGKKIKEMIQHILKERNVTIPFDIVSNPEFLKEGHAIEDFLKPDRIVVGVESAKAREIMESLYAPFVRNGHPILYMNIPSSEMTKYTANAMLATKISFINEIAKLCEKTGADIEQVRKGIGSDSRIGYHFIYPGLGYGGSCFPKDVQALLKTGKSFGEEMNILDAVEKVNHQQRLFFIEKILKYYNNQLKGLHFALWGLSFKPNTDDIREAPAIDVIKKLIDYSATVTVYDPIAVSNIKNYFGNQNGITYSNNQYSALDQADALCLITEWKPFQVPDFDKMKTLLRKPVIFDGRNQYNPELLKEMGFEYYCIGR